MGRTSKRETLMDTAETLFERNGFVATGINQITQEAGVAPMTLYNNFANKEELIVATLERRSTRFLDLLERTIEEAGNNPRERIFSIFDCIDDWVKEERETENGFAGCTFVKASIEFGDLNHPSHRVAMQHKMELIELFEENIQAIGHDNPKELALELHLLIDGAVVQAQMLGDARSTDRAKKIAKTLLE